MPKIFFGFPYDFDREFGAEYRLTLRRAAEDQKCSHVFGDSEISAGALMDKLVACIDACDHAYFDITGFNPSVMLELGAAFYAKGKIHFYFNGKRHRASPLYRVQREEIPTDIRGQDHFEYETVHDLDFGIRNSLRAALGVGKSSLDDLKIRINSALKKGPQRISEIAETIGVPERESVSQALYVLRAEQKVTCSGVGMGAKWELRRGH
jgi:hypothetical protein